VSVRSTFLCSQTQIGGASPTTLFTVPSGETWLAKLITCTSDTDGLVCYVGRNTPAAGSSKNLWTFSNLLAGIPQSYATFWALTPGMVLQAIRSAGGSCRITIDGAKLLGVA